MGHSGRQYQWGWNGKESFPDQCKKRTEKRTGCAGRVYRSGHNTGEQGL